MRLTQFFIAAAMAAIPWIISDAADVRHSSAADNERGEAILDILSSVEGDAGKKMLVVAEQLIGTPSGSDLENDSIGTALLNLQSFTPMSFVNSTLALVKASEAPHPNLSAIDDAWISVSRRRGEDNGFASKMIYSSDWIVDNVYRGNLTELTELIGDGSFKTKNLDYVTRHRDEYPALKDSATYDRMKMVEMGFRNHKIPHLKKQSIGKKEITERLQDGDIIIFLSPLENFDLHDIGIIRMRDGVPYLIHVTGEGVTEEKEPLPRYFKLNNQYFYGYRIVRPQ